jgi:hypothetical protein
MAHADDAGELLVQQFYLWPYSFSVDTFLTHPFLEMLDEQAALFVSEAKTMDSPLAKHVAQAVAEMFACAKKLQSTYLDLLLLTNVQEAHRSWGSLGRPKLDLPDNENEFRCKRCQICGV